MSGKPFKSAIIGSPVAHSLSPVIHNHWLAQYGLEGRYDKVEIAPSDLATGLPDLIAQGYRGFNVTLPHKQAVMPLCRTIDETGRAIGAVNTLTVEADGQCDAINTDWFGFIEALLAARPEFDFARARILVLGAGGAARSVIYGLQRRGVRDVTVTNRTADKAAALAADFGVTIVPWAERQAAAHGVTLLVNTTSLGLHGQPPLDFDVAALPVFATVYDIVYKPLQTQLLADAAARGLATVDGLGMLIHQARLSFHAWTGRLPEATEDLRRALLDALDA